MEGVILRQVILAVILCFYIAAGARKLGYSGFVWFLVSLLSGPIFAIALLPSLPNRAAEKIRREERLRLDKELAEARQYENEAGGALPEKTIGDEGTVVA